MRSDTPLYHSLTVSRPHIYIAAIQQLYNLYSYTAIQQLYSIHPLQHPSGYGTFGTAWPHQGRQP